MTLRFNPSIFAPLTADERELLQEIAWQPRDFNSLAAAALRFCAMLCSSEDLDPHTRRGLALAAQDAVLRLMARAPTTQRQARVKGELMAAAPLQNYHFNALFAATELADRMWLDHILKEQGAQR